MTCPNESNPVRCLSNRREAFMKERPGRPNPCTNCKIGRAREETAAKRREKQQNRGRPAEPKQFCRDCDAEMGEHSSSGYCRSCRAKRQTIRGPSPGSIEAHQFIVDTAVASSISRKGAA